MAIYIDKITSWLFPQQYIMNRWVDLVIYASLFMVGMLLFIKYFGGGRWLKNTRRNMCASAYEILLYHRSIRMILRAEAKLVWNNTKILFLLIPSLVFGGILFAVLYHPLAERYGYRAFKPDEMVIADISSINDLNWKIDDDSRVKITGQVSLPEQKKLWLRFTPLHEGILTVNQDMDGKDELVFKWEPPGRPITPEQKLNGIKVNINYPRQGWLIEYIVVCMIVGIPWTKWLGVSI
jgi:hypothetical protein